MPHTHPVMARFLARGRPTPDEVAYFLDVHQFPLTAPGAAVFACQGQWDGVELVRWIHGGADRHRPLDVAPRSRGRGAVRVAPSSLTRSGSAAGIPSSTALRSWSRHFAGRRNGPPHNEKTDRSRGLPLLTGSEEEWMPSRTVNIGLSLGADICWPICYETLFERLKLDIELGGDRLKFHCERVTIEPFNLRQPVKYDLVIDRLTHWYSISREWIKI
jgi:hypothetical protein